ncbi:hypothetical protein MYOV057v1_p0031 [Vibrio phage 184E37.1]|nr:hypothetical protein MYOV057v1_p0031 [Vibrio phage 184E37.1]
MIPESEWTKGQREFVGTTFDTPSGSVLSVTGLLVGGKHPKFSVECSVCSRDTELFPDGVFSSQKGILQNRDGSLNKIPFGCSGKHSFTIEQHKVRVFRECVSRDYELLALYKDPTGRLKIDLNCNKTEERSFGLGMSQFLIGRDAKLRGLIKSKNTRRSKELSTDCTIKVFKTLKPEYERLKFTKVAYKSWEVTCPICDKDFISKAVPKLKNFKVTEAQIKRKMSICRCHRPLYRCESEIEIQRVLYEEGGIFLGWCEGMVGNNYQFSFKDKAGHINRITYNNFKNGRRCRLCAKNGFNPSKPASFYIVRWGIGGHQLLEIWNN